MRGDGTTGTAAAPADICSHQVRRTAGTTVPRLSTTISATSGHSSAIPLAAHGSSSTLKGHRSTAAIPSLESPWSCMSAPTTTALALLILGTHRSTAPPASDSPAVRSSATGLTGRSRMISSKLKRHPKAVVSLTSLTTRSTSSLWTSTASSSARSQRGSLATRASSTRTDRVSSQALPCSAVRTDESLSASS